jgi:hypothetical protein
MMVALRFGEQVSDLRDPTVRVDFIFLNICVAVFRLFLPARSKERDPTHETQEQQTRGCFQ